MSRRRDWLIRDSRSLPVDAASRALRGDVDGSAAAQEPSSRLLAAEIADMFERAGPLVRGASEVVAWELEAIAAHGEKCLKHGEVGEAVALLSTLGAGICAGYEKIWDEESEVGMVIDRCVEGLEACLDRAEPNGRRYILGALLDIDAFESFGGVLAVVVPDNLKAAVIRAAFAIDDKSVLNRSYRELEEVAGQRVHGTTRKAPRQRFDASAVNITSSPPSLHLNPVSDATGDHLGNSTRHMRSTSASSTL